jgi:hypothetical protein
MKYLSFVGSLVLPLIHMCGMFGLFFRKAAQKCHDSSANILKGFLEAIKTNIAIENCHL